MHTHLERNICERTAERALQDLLGKIERWKFAGDMEPIRLRLNAARGLAADPLMREIIAIVEQNTGRVYRLIRHVGRGFVESEQYNPVARPVLRHIETITMRHPGDLERLAPSAEDFTARCMLALAGEIGRRLPQREITMDDLWDIFSSGPGAGIVGKLMFEPFR
jgi:hypothetical protein